MIIPTKEDKDKIVLEIDNGDKQKIDAVMERWKFKDYQSFLRFVSSVFLDTQGNSMYLNTDTGVVRVSPAKHLLKDVLDTEEKGEYNAN